MGQAKRRGTFEQRRAMAMEKKMTVKRPMVATPSRRHVSRMSIMVAAVLAAGALPILIDNPQNKGNE